MNKMLFALLVAAVSFGTMPMASAGKQVKEGTSSKKVVKKKNYVYKTVYNLPQRRDDFEVDTKGNVWRLEEMGDGTQLRTPEAIVKGYSVKTFKGRDDKWHVVPTKRKNSKTQKILSFDDVEFPATN